MCGILRAFRILRTFHGAAFPVLPALTVLFLPAFQVGIGRAAGEDFHDAFEGEKLGAGWEFEASRNYPGAECKGGASGLELKAAAAAYILLRRSIDAPGTDDRPLVVTARISYPQNASWDPCLVLWWDDGNFLALSAGRDNSALGRLVFGGARRDLFHAGGCTPDVSGTGIWLRMVVSSRTVNCYTSGDGAVFDWRALAEREAALAGPPRKLIVGRGWTCAAEGFASPLFANDHPGCDKTPASVYIREVSVTDEPWEPSAEPPEIEKKDRWADTEAAIEVSQALRRWKLIGPIPDPAKAVFSPAPGKQMPPEQSDDWSQPMKDLSGGPLKTVPYAAEGDEETLVDLTRALGRGDKSTFYAQAVCDRKAAGAARLWLDASDPFRLWVNGRPIGVAGAPQSKRKLKENRLAVPIVLRKGRNFIRLKIYNEKGDCGFYARLEPMDPGSRIRILEALLQRHPDDPERWRRSEALLRIAGHWEDSHRYDKALEALAEAAKTGPDASAEAFRRKTALLARLGRWDDLAADCDDAIANGAPSGDAVFPEYCAAWAEAKSGKADRAYERLRRFGEAPPQMPSRAAIASRLRARLAMQAGDLHAAWKMLAEDAGTFDRAQARADAAGEYLALGCAAFNRCVKAAVRGAAPGPSDIRLASSAFRKTIELLPSGAAGQVPEYVRRAETLAAHRPLESVACLWAAAFLCHFLQDPAIRADASVGSGLRLPEPFDPNRPEERTASDIASAVWSSGPFAEWEVTGPFSEAQVLERKGTPEWDSSAGATYADVENKPIKWVKVSKFSGGLIGVTGFGNLAAGRHGVYCYARRDIERPADEQTSIRVSAYGPIAVFLNGKPVLDEPRNERYVLDGYAVPVTLKKGINRLLVRARKTQDAFGFTLRFGKDPSAGLKVVETLHMAACRPAEFLPSLNRLGHVARAMAECGRAEAGAALARSATVSCPPDDIAAKIGSIGQEMEILKFVERARVLAGLLENILLELRMLPPHPFVSEAAARVHLQAGNLYARYGMLSLAMDRWTASARWSDASFDGRQAMLSLAANLAYSGMGESAAPYLDRLRSAWGSGPDILEQVRAISNHIANTRMDLIYYDVSPDAQAGIESALRQAEHGDTDRAVRALHETANSYESGLFLLDRQGSRRRYVGIREYARYVLAGGKERPAYLRIFGGEADAAIARAVSGYDPDGLRRTAFDYYLTPAAGRALNRLGNIYMDEGKYELAMTEFRRVILDHPDCGVPPAMLWAKYGYAAARLGRREEAERAVAVLGGELAGERMVVGGREVSGAEYAERLRDMMGRARPADGGAALPSPGEVREGSGKASPAAPPLAPMRWVYRWPVAPIEETAGELDRPSPFRRFPARLISYEGRVYGHGMHNIFCLDLDTGSPVWKDDLPAEGARLPLDRTGAPICAPCAGDGRIYAKMLVGRTIAIRCYDAAHGRLLWSTEGLPEARGLAFVGQPAFAYGRVYCSAIMPQGMDTAHFLVCLDAASGNLMWKTTIGTGEGGFRLADEYIHLNFNEGPPSVSDGTVYAPTGMAGLAAADAFSGEIRWVSTYQRLRLRDWTLRAAFLRACSAAGNPPILTSEVVALAPSDHPGIVAFDRKSGRMLWEDPFAWGRRLIGAKGNVLVYTADYAAAVDIRSGARLWTFVPPDGGICGVGAIWGDYVYLPTPSGVLRLSVASGDLADGAPWDRRAGECGNLLLLRDRFLASAPGRAVCFGGPEGKASAWTAAAEARALELSGDFSAAASKYREGSAAGGTADLRALCAIGEVRALAAAGRKDEAAERLRAVEKAIPAMVSEPGRWEADRASVLDSLSAAVGIAGRRNRPPPAGRFSAVPAYAWQVGDSQAERIAWWPMDGPAGVAAEAIYALAGGWLYAVEPSPEGRILWKSFAGPGAARLHVSERFVAAVAPRSLRMFDRLSGEIRWTWELPPDYSGMHHSAGWDEVLYWVETGEKAVLLRSRFYVRALDVVSGKPLWAERYDEHYSPVHAMLSREDAAVVIHTASRQNPDLVWTRYDAASGRIVGRKALGQKGHVSSALLLRGSNRFVLARGGNITAFDALKGDKAWETPAIHKESANWWDSRLSLDGDILVSSGSEGRRNGPFVIEAFDPADGRLLFRHRGWSVPVGGGRFLVWQDDAGSLMEAVPGGVGAKAIWTARDERFRRENAVWAGQSGGAVLVLTVREDAFVLRAFGASDGSILYERTLAGSVIRGEYGRPIVPVFLGGDLLVYGAREGLFAAFGGTPVGVTPEERARRIVADPQAPPKAIVEARRTLADLAPPGHMAFLSEEVPRAEGAMDAAALAEPIVLASPADYVPAGRTFAWGGPEDISVRAAVSWDAKKIRLIASVKDDSFVPPAPGADHASGDSLRVVLSSVPASRSGSERAEVFDFSVALGEGGVSVQKRLGGERLKIEARAALDAEARAIFYEIAVPWESVRENPYHRPGERRDMGLGICAYDNDGQGPKGAMEWGAGISSRPLNPARLGVISFLDLSPRRISQYRKVIDLIPDDPVAWKFLQTIALKYRGPDAVRGRINEYEGFVRAHPGSDNASKALTELRRLYSIEMKGGDPEDRVLKLARETGVSSEEMDDFAGKEFRFRLCLDPAEPPSMFMVQFCIEGEGWNRRAYWGESRVDWGRHGTFERMPMGKLPEPGKWADMKIRASDFAMERLAVRGVAFTSFGGRFWVDRVAWTAGGEEKVLIEDALPEKIAIEGNRFSLADSPVASGRKSLAGGASKQLFNGHIVGTEGPLFSFGRPPEPRTQASVEKLTAKLREAVDEIPDMREGFEFLMKVLEGISPGKDEKERGRVVLAELEGFVRKHPDSPNVPAVLDMLVERYREDGAALPIQKAEAFMTECRVPVGGRLAFFRRHAPPFTRWHVMGPFKAHGDRLGMDAQYIPEDRTGLNTDETFTRDGAEYAWRIYSPPKERKDGYVDLKSFFGEAAAGDVCAYAYAKFDCGSAKRALLLYGARSIISIYVNGRKAVDAAESRPDKDGQTAEIRLKRGENEVLIKVGGRDGRIGFFFRIAETDGKPVSDLTVVSPAP